MNLSGKSDLTDFKKFSKFPYLYVDASIKLHPSTIEVEQSFISYVSAKGSRRILVESSSKPISENSVELFFTCKKYLG